MTQRHRLLGLVSCLLVLTAGVWALAAPATAPASAPADDNPLAGRKITLLHSFVLGVIEGLTEYLPVSSTGHLILASHAMGLSEFAPEQGPLGPRLHSAPAVEAFEIVIQFGAILAVIGLYRKPVGQMALGLAGRDPQGLKLLGLLALAFIPSAIGGLLLHRTIEELLFGPTTVAYALIVGGVAMVVAERVFAPRGPGAKRITRLADMNYWQALFIGLAQVLAMWPGTSRSMITIVAALAIGLDMLAAAEFSFLLALPTLGAATAYSAVKEWDVLMDSTGLLALLVGIVVSGLVAALAVKLFVRWLTRHGLLPFGLYRVALGVVVLLYFVR